MITAALIGFTVGFLLVVVWKAAGRARERARNVAVLVEAFPDLRDLVTSHTARLDTWDFQLPGQFESFQKALQVRLDAIAAGSSDAAIAQLAARISAIEKQLTAQDLTILDTAERVAHKLQDRRRKREAAEAGDVDEIQDPQHEDPAFALARARAFYNTPQPQQLPPQDPQQLELVREA